MSTKCTFVRVVYHDTPRGQTQKAERDGECTSPCTFAASLCLAIFSFISSQSSIPACRARFIPLWQFHLTKFHRQRIVNQQSPDKKISDAQNILDSLDCLQRSHDAYRCAQNADFATRRHCPLFGHILKNAAIARAFSWQDGHDLPAESRDSRMRKRLMQVHAGIIDEKFCREIICAVENEVIAAVTENILGIVLRDSLSIDVNAHSGIKSGERPRHRICLLPANIR